MLVGVVAGGDHHTGVRLLLHRQEGHGRGGDGAQQQHIAAHGADARRKGRLQHIRGDAGILADGDHRPAAQLLLQYDGHGLAHMKGQLRRQIFADDTADAVRTK